MIVFLSELDTYNIAFESAERCKFKRDAGILNSKRIDKKRDDYQVTREGLTGEYAVSQVLGVGVNKELYLGGDPGWDFEYKGLKIDVKTTRAKFLLFDSLDKFIADVAVLSRYVDHDLVDVVGIISRKKFLEHCQYRDFGYGNKCVVDETHLSPIEMLLNYE